MTIAAIALCSAQNPMPLPTSIQTPKKRSPLELSNAQATSPAELSSDSFLGRSTVIAFSIISKLVNSWYIVVYSRENPSCVDELPRRRFVLPVLEPVYAALDPLASGESTVFVEEPFGLFGHIDTDLFPFEGERYPESTQVRIRNVDFHVEGLFIDPGG